MGALINVLSSLLGGIGKVGGAIGSGIGKVGSTVGGGVQDLFGNIAAGGAPVGEAGGEAPTGLKGIFQNKLLAQLLSAEGQDLMQNTPGKNLGAVEQQNIASQNLARVFANILAGKATAPEGITYKTTGGKSTFEIDHEQHPHPLSIGSLGTKTNEPLTNSMIKAPTSDISASVAKFLQGAGNPSPSQPATTAPAPAGAEAQVPNAPVTSDPTLQMLTQLLGGNQVNLGAGFANLRPSDLAGVTPEMLSQTLQFKMQQEQLGKKNIMDVLGMMTDIDRNRILENYYTGQLSGTEAAQKIAKAREFRMWYDQLTEDKRTEFQKDYEFAVNKGFEGTPAQWKGVGETGNWKDYQLAGGLKGTGKSYEEWLTTHERQRAITTPEMAGDRARAIKVATGAEEAWTQLHNPTQLNALVKRAVDDPVTANAIFAARDNPGEMTRIKGRTVAGVIDNIIRTGGGRFVKDTVLSKDGKTLTYTIKWPNHPEPEVFTYAIE